MNLSPEETLAYEFANRWRDENYRPASQDMDWLRFAKISPIIACPYWPCKSSNVLIYPFLQTRGSSFANKLKNMNAPPPRLGNALITYLKSAETRDIKTIVLKGLWMCEKIYQNPAIRPGADIDILVQRGDVDACLNLLSEQGIGEFWPNLLKDEYFTRHHLHQQRSNPDLSIWFEIHWAFDHPYTLLTVDYESIFARAQRSTLS